MMAVLGSDSFREWAYSIKSDDEEITRKSRQIPNLPVRTIVMAVAEKFEATEDSILKATRGRGLKWTPLSRQLFQILRYNPAGCI